MPESRPTENASPLRYTRVPGIHSPVSIRAVPGAMRTLGPEGGAELKRALKAYAGRDGIARFHLRPSWASEEIAKLVVEGVKEGKAAPAAFRSWLRAVSGALFDLANYGSAVMFNASARKANAARH